MQQKQETGGIAIKFNDDGEPSGTAGSPILKIVLEQGISNVLVVVTRYFGGILLGTGGLVRAYSDATIKALKNTEYVTKTIGYELQIDLKYDQFEQFKYYANKNDIRIVNAKYLENIELIVETAKQNIEELTNSNNKKNFELLKIDIIKEKYIEK